VRYKQRNENGIAKEYGISVAELEKQNPKIKMDYQLVIN
jgi:hypothetical protein